MIHIGVTPQQSITESQLQYNNLVNFEVPSNSIITGVVLNVKKNIKVINDGYSSQISFTLEDDNIEVAVCYEVQDCFPSSPTSAVIKFNRLNNNCLVIPKNELVLDYVVYNYNTYAVSAILDENTTLQVKLNKLGL